jgi:TP901 family phage tail tape measure protein
VSESRSLVTRHLQEWVTRGDEKLLQVGRQLATADRAREREQRRLQASYRQLAEAASNAGLREVTSIRDTTAASSRKTHSIKQLGAAEQRLQREVLGAARAQLTEERALRLATRAAQQYATAKARQVESISRVTAATNAQNAALARNTRAAGTAASRGSVIGEARQTGSRGIGLATGVAGAAGAAGVFGIANLAREAIDYERQMSQVQAVMGATRAEMQQLDALAVDLGAKTAYAASDSAMALGELGKAGFTAQQSLKTLPGTIDLAAASGTDLAEAATIQSDALRGFGLDADQAGRVADVFAVAVNRSAIEMSDLGYTLKYMAPIAATTGQSFEDMSAAVAILGNVGIRGDTAGTTLRRIMTSIVKPTKNSVAALDELGLAAEDLQGPNGLKPLPDIIARLVEEADKLPKADQLRVMTTIFGRESISGTMALLDHGAPKLRKLSAEMRNYEGAADDMARTMQDNVYYQVEQVTGAIESLALTIFKEFAPGLQSAATDAAGSIEAWTDAEGNVERVTGAISDFTSTIGDLIEAGMPLVTMGVAVVDAWQALPDPVRSSVLQFGALALVSRKLAGSAAAGGLISVLGRLRSGLRATSAEAVAAQSALGGLSATGSGPAATEPRRALVATAAGPSPVARAAREATVTTAAAATRQGSIATRLRVEARDAAAAYERDMRRMAAMPMIVARAEQQASLLRNTTALGGGSPARLGAAEAAAAAARQQLQTLRESTVASGRHAAERQAAAAAATAEARATAQTATLLRSQAAHHARMDAMVAPGAGRLARGREGRPLGAIGTWQMTRGLGGTRREAAAEAARRTAARIPTPTVTGRGVAGAAAAGGIGAALSGGSVASAALSGGAIGMMAGPWGAAAGAAGAAGITALVNEFRSASTERAEKAAREFGERVTERSTRHAAAGIQGGRTAQQLAQSTAVAREGREIVRYAGWLEERGADDNSIRRALGGRAEAAGLDLDALLSGTSNAFAKAASDAAGAFEAELKRHRFSDSRSLMDNFVAVYRGLPREAQQQGANTMIELARAMEREGRAPKGTVDRLLRDLERRFDGLAPSIAGKAIKATRDVDRALNDRKLVTSTDKLVREMGTAFDQLPQAAVKSVPGAVAMLGAQLKELHDIASDKNAPEEMRKQAEAAMPKLQGEFDRALRRMAKRMGISVEDARTWAGGVVAAAEDVGNGRSHVDTLTSSVAEMNRQLSAGEEAARKLTTKLDDLGVSSQRVSDAIANGEMAISLRTLPEDFPAPPGRKKGKDRRTGGAIVAYSHGGPIIDTMMSGGEEYLPPAVAARYPPGVLDAIEQIQRPHFGAYNLGGHIVPGPSDRDGTYVPAQPGGFVLTGHGRQLRDEIMGFAKGGFVATAYGPPWGGIEGTGITKTGVDLRKGPKRYIIAVDPSVIPLHTRTGVWPNPFGYRGKFAAEDTGGAIKGKRIDFYDWRGRESQNKWGRRTVSVGTTSVRDDGSKASTPGYSYIKTTDDVKGMSARDAHRQRATLRTPNVDVSGVFDQARQGSYDAVARAQTLSDVIAAGRVNIERTKVNVEGIDGRDAPGSEGGVNAGATPRVAKMATWAKRAVNKWPKYVYGGGHGASNSGPYDCSGLVSSILSYGGFGKPGTTDALKNFGLAGTGKQITIGVRGSTGRNAHAMIKLGQRFFEAGGGGAGGSVGERTGWSGTFPIKRHPKGYRTGGQVVDPEGLRRAPRVVRDRLAVPGAMDPGSPAFVGYGLRRGGSIRRMATGGRVGSTSRIVRDTRRAIDTTAANRVLGSLYGAGVREQRQVTDALEQLQNLLGQANKVTVDRLGALNRELVRGIDRTRAKSSPKGAAISRGEQAQNRRSQSAMSLVQAELLRRASAPAARAAELAGAIDDQAAMVERSMRRANVDPESVVGLQRIGRQADWEKAQRGVQLGRLEQAREIARKAGRSGRDTVRGLDEEIKALRNDIAELAVQQVENARAQVARAVQDHVDAAQYRVDYQGAQMAEFDATQSLHRTAGTVGGLMQRGAYQQAQYGPLIELRDALLHQASIAAQVHGQDSAQFRTAMQSAQQVAAQAVQTLADGAEAIRQASMMAVQQVVDRAAHGTTMSNLALQRIELEQRLAKTYESGGHARADYVRSQVIPALQSELVALEQKRAESERQEAGQADKPLTRADMEAIAAKQNEILQAQLTAAEAIEANTNSKRTGGSLGFGFGGDVYTDVLLDGVGA